ncbi:hypothetical protein K435DRAFT_807816 [Dendrothele bispora CBS 962.96]|uniref:Uncharacterized protein n=1 Tax=Dendrothele bispora (strain CBS 962.96) TaxID=1314807 RepID=A0A4S8L421_DENBC|nr:hypothetical protein K435DRAFT_807816 [Dendrothele bispora CBS 962.96]
MTTPNEWVLQTDNSGPETPDHLKTDTLSTPQTAGVIRPNSNAFTHSDIRQFARHTLSHRVIFLLRANSLAPPPKIQNFCVNLTQKSFSVVNWLWGSVGLAMEISHEIEEYEQEIERIDQEEAQLKEEIRKIEEEMAESDRRHAKQRSDRRNQQPKQETKPRKTVDPGQHGINYIDDPMTVPQPSLPCQPIPSGPFPLVPDWALPLIGQNARLHHLRRLHLFSPSYSIPKVTTPSTTSTSQIFQYGTSSPTPPTPNQPTGIRIAAQNPKTEQSNNAACRVLNLDSQNPLVKSTKEAVQPEFVKGITLFRVIVGEGIGEKAGREGRMLEHLHIPAEPDGGILSSDEESDREEEMNAGTFKSLSPCAVMGNDASITITIPGVRIDMGSDVEVEVDGSENSSPDGNPNVDKNSSEEESS